MGSSCGKETTDENHNSSNNVVKPQSPNNAVNISEASWAYPFVIWGNGKTYKISDTIVEEDKVGNEIGQVKRDISNMDTISMKDGVAEQPYVEQDGDSNMLKVGSKIFVLNGADEENAIVVSHKGKYLKTVDVR